jgi:hypothetical protein
MFGTIGLTSFLLLPLMAAAGMVLVGGSTVLAPSVLILLPFIVARAG